MDLLELNRDFNSLERREPGREVVAYSDSPGSVASGAGVGAYTQIISSQVPNAGTLLEAAPLDSKPGLKLVQNPADNPYVELFPSLEFTAQTSGLQVRRWQDWSGLDETVRGMLGLSADGLELPISQDAGNVLKSRFDGLFVESSGAEGSGTLIISGLGFRVGDCKVSAAVHTDHTTDGFEWLLTDGRQMTDGAGAHAVLYAAIGTKFGGTGPSSFNLPNTVTDGGSPDAEGRVIVGAGDPATAPRERGETFGAIEQEVDLGDVDIAVSNEAHDGPPLTAQGEDGIMDHGAGEAQAGSGQTVIVNGSHSISPHQHEVTDIDAYIESEENPTVDVRQPSIAMNIFILASITTVEIGISGGGGGTGTMTHPQVLARTLGA